MRAGGHRCGATLRLLTLLLLLLPVAPVAAQRASDAVTDAPLATAEAEALLARMSLALGVRAFDGELNERLRFPESDERSGRGFTNPPLLLPELVLRNYAPRIAARGERLGRPTTTLRLEPTGIATPTWSFVIDDASGLPLAYEAVAADGRPVAQGSYRAVRGVRQGGQRDAAPLERAALTELRGSLTSLLGDGAIPEGFVAIDAQLASIADVEALRITFYDGLTPLLLFVYPRQRALPERRWLRSSSFDNLSVSVLGPLPEAQLERWLTVIGAGPVKTLDLRAFERVVRALE